jgi:hypothetical protein
MFTVSPDPLSHPLGRFCRPAITTSHEFECGCGCGCGCGCFRFVAAFSPLVMRNAAFPIKKKAKRNLSRCYSTIPSALRGATLQLRDLHRAYRALILAAVTTGVCPSRGSSNMCLSICPSAHLSVGLPACLSYSLICVCVHPNSCAAHLACQLLNLNWGPHANLMSSAQGHLMRTKPEITAQDYLHNHGSSEMCGQARVARNGNNFK